MPGVIAHNLFHRVGDLRTRVDVLRNVSFEAPAGRLTAVVGPSGAGKTSLLHLLAGLDRPVGGSVYVDERPLQGLAELELTRLRRERIGLLLPAASVLHTVSVRENVTLPLLIARRAPEAATIDALLERVGLSNHAEDRAGELGVADRQRAALARSIAGGPSALLADEPAGDLDEDEGAALLELLRDIAHEDGITVILFTRDADAAEAVADHVIELDGGRVVEAAATALAA
ncbi:MAG TPA: ATP-binding cassette domain-containing protein [Solirubrobacteraceae bacterium]|jgi:putative ABC transport system ATP-binding protein|nr:ATP-binding cassette domain-containing protein [Solirubrobacteraceae bacterium]